MKILLTAVNAKYIHSNLAIYSLASYAEKKLPEIITADELPKIKIAEYTINQPIEKVLTDIYKQKPDVLFLSCYIWNRKEIEEIVLNMGKIRPELNIWLGGPEVSFDCIETMKSLPNVKGITRGEGEEVFCRILESYASSGSGKEYNEIVLDEFLGKINSITFRNREGQIITNPECSTLDLSDVPFPYNTLENFEHRIIYYESSRGCPFRCSYCLSSVEKSLRFRDFDLVRNELKYFIDRKIPQVKFIDRTFNCSHDHAMNIWKFVKDHDNGITNFHFEIAGDLLNDEELELLGSLRPGQVQLEIGVQSTNEKTLKEINRPMDFAHLAEVVKTIKDKNNIHLHLDLIAGLPFEDYESFKKSFDDVFSLRPEQLQLGFLKVLKGSPIELRCDDYNLKYTESPPYEVLGTKWISYDELIKLKSVEEMLEVYYNSGQFINTVELLLKHFESPFEFFDRLASWYENQGLEMLNFSRNQRYEKLLNFGTEIISDDEREVLQEVIIYDYYLRDNVKNRPDFLGNEKVEKAFSKEFYSIESREHQYLTSKECNTDDPRRLRNLTHLEKFGDKYYLFDYTRRNPMNNNAKIIEIKK